MGSRVSLGVAVASLVLALPAAASATTWQVTSTGDGPFTCPSASACTLRGAIAAADGGSGSDAVVVPAGSYTVSVNPINVTKGMAIVGTGGAAATTIEQTEASRGILVISSGVTSVTITGITFTHGHAADGGAISSQAASLTLSGDVFTANGTDVIGDQGNGGAVGITTTAPTTLTVASSTFSSNRAGSDGTAAFESGIGSGGAIDFAAPGRVAVSDSVFDSNTAGGSGDSASSSGKGSGGAIWADASSTGGRLDVSIVRTRFASNSAGGDGSSGPLDADGTGGALGVSVGTGEGSLSVADSTFSNNSAGGSGGSNFAAAIGEGGAIAAFAVLNHQLPASVDRSTFTQNTTGGDGGSDVEDAQGFGGAVEYESDAPGVMTVSNSTFDGNTAGGVAGAGTDAGLGEGGSIVSIGNGRLALTNDTLANGRAGGASGRGGNLAAPAGTTLKNTILSHGIADTGANCSAAVTSFGHNIETANDCGLTAAGDHPNTEPDLLALRSNGGLTDTMGLGAGSTAIDGGDNAGCPATDQRGVLRPAGAACDIGAFEVATPGATTGAVSEVRATSATLGGTAFNPDLQPAFAEFEYGTTTSYGDTTGAQELGVGALPVGIRLTLLKPRTTYHFRMFTTNAVGKVVGADQTFTTITGAIVSDVRLRPSKIVAQSGRGASITKAKRKRRGATLSFHATDIGTTVFTVQRPRRGYRSGKRCVPRRPHRKGKPRRCTLYKNLGSFSAPTIEGVNKLHFTGRVKQRPLHPGRYRLRVVEKDRDGHNGPANTRAFTVVH